MPLGSILATVVAYIAIAVLLLSLNLPSRWRWWIKGSAIIILGFFFVGSYVAISALLGWPTQARVPDRFSLVGTRIIEPDETAGMAGTIFLWVERLDENNVPNGPPRSYQLAYTAELAETVGRAQELLNQGEPVEGTIEEVTEEPEDTGSDAADDAPPGPTEEGDPRRAAAYPAEDLNLQFNDLPAVQLPDKGVL